MIFNEAGAERLAKPFADSSRLVERLELWDSKQGKYIPFKLWPIQKEILWAFNNFKRVILLKKRQVGGTQLYMADAIAQSLLVPKMTTLFLSVGQSEADTALKRGKDMIERIPKPVRVASKYSSTTEVIRFEGVASTITSLTASNGRSSTASRICVDEAAFMTPRNSQIELDEVLRNVMPAIDQTDGQIVIISTADGVGGAYHKLFTQAVAGNNSFLAIFISCWDDPGFTEAKRIQIVNDFGDDHARAEYPRTHTEAFLASGRPRFDGASLDTYETRKLSPTLTGEITAGDIIERNDNGNLLFFDRREVYGQYVLACDVAEGLEKGDFSVVKVLNIQSCDQVAEWHGHIDHSLFGETIYWLAVHYNMAMVVIEANNHGHSTITSLRSMGYPDELIWSSMHTRDKSDDDYTAAIRYGWLTTAKSKRMIVDNLARLLLDRQAPRLSAQDISELRTYIIDPRGGTNAELNCFDDRVMSLAIGLYVLPFVDTKMIDELHSCCGYCQNYSGGVCDITKIKRDAAYWCSCHVTIDFKCRPDEIDSRKRYRRLTR